MTVDQRNGSLCLQIMLMIMDPEPEHSFQKIPHNLSQPSYREEEPLSEASNTSLPSLDVDTGWTPDYAHECV